MRPHRHTRQELTDQRAHWTQLQWHLVLFSDESVTVDVDNVTPTCVYVMSTGLVVVAYGVGGITSDSRTEPLIVDSYLAKQRYPD